MKVLLLCSTNIRITPYIFVYLELLIKLKCDITLFYWDRDGKEDRPLPKEVKVICFKKPMENQIPKYKKVINFLRYRKEAIRVIKKNEYDLVIVFVTQFAVLLSDILINKYKNNYIFDYRDPSLEKYSIYRKRVSSVVLNSRATFISSDAYRQFLPEFQNIYCLHNLSIVDLMHREIRRLFPRERKVIRISFWGLVRRLDINLSIIKEIGNDKRFELHYYGKMGKEAKEIQEYCRKNDIKNVYMNKEYLPHERYEFIKTTDIIHNAYSNRGYSNPAIGNKFYEGIIFYIPQFCTIGGFMGDEVEKYRIGIKIDPSKSFADALYDYYQNIDWNVFEKNCDACLDSILKEYEHSINSLNEMIKLRS